MKKYGRLITILLITCMLFAVTVSCKKKDEDDSEDLIQVENNSQAGTSVESEGEKPTDDKPAEQDKPAKQDKPADDKQPVEENKDTEDSSETETPDEPQPPQDDEHPIPLLECPLYKDGEDILYSHTTIFDLNFLPDASDEIDKSADRATKNSKYTAEFNPILNDDGKENQYALPSMSIDDTGFVRAGTKLSDLNRKTLTFFTAEDKPLWSYRDYEGKLVDEWKWFDSLKDEIGLSVKYTVSQGITSLQSARKNIVAGKACDIICTNSSLSVHSFTISRSITPLININNNGSSPGVCKRTMDACMWGNTLRIIAPVGVVDVLWYNQTLSDKLGLTSPHATWQKGEWNCNSFEAYLASANSALKNNGKTVAFSQNIADTMFSWAATNGKTSGMDRNIVSIGNTTDGLPTVFASWHDEHMTHVFKYITSFNGKFKYENKDYSGLFDGSILMTPTIYTQVENSQNIKLNWVPFPKSDGTNSAERCRTSARGMMLPYKTSDEGNVAIALKFMELWATRYTESYFDNLSSYGLDLQARKEYFKFTSENAVLAPEFCGDLFKTELVGGEFYKALGGDSFDELSKQLRIVSEGTDHYVVNPVRSFGEQD